MQQRADPQDGSSGVVSSFGLKHQIDAELQEIYTDKLTMLQN